MGTDAAATARALELAYRYLNRRERTVQEVRRHLSGRDLEPPAVEAALAELVETGYLDDARYARLFAQDKRALGQWGSGRIRNALLARGLGRDVVEGALAGPATPAGAETAEGAEGPGEPGESGAEGEFERAAALLQRRFPNPPRERRERQRALGVLLRRGYEPELAMDVLAAYARQEI